MAAKKLKNCATMSTSMIQNLPKEIIFDIFARLPIRSISRVRFVCRSWFDFIKDPHFQNFHLSQIAQKAPNFLILLIRDFHLVNLDQKHGCFLPNFLPKNLKPFNVLYHNAVEPVKLICSVNGLICLRYTYSNSKNTEIETFQIWNPITRDVFTLPRSHSPDRNKNFISEIGVSGFGFDSTTNKYKLVHTWYPYNFEDLNKDKYGMDTDGIKGTEIGIYTLGVRNWKMIQGIPSSFYFIENASQVFVNGALHFMMKSNNPEFKNCIGVVDIGRETFRWFKGPNGTDTKFSRLYAVEDCLCVTVYSDCPYPSKVTLWTMNDYGVTETWTARYTICNGFPTSLFTIDFSEPEILLKILNTGRKGVFLFVSGDTQFYYDLEKKKLQQFQISGIQEYRYPRRNVGGVDVHLCSLISPRAIARARRRRKNIYPVMEIKDIGGK